MANKPVGESANADVQLDLAELEIHKRNANTAKADAVIAKLAGKGWTGTRLT